jgi:hypothetical protein
LAAPATHFEELQPHDHQILEMTQFILLCDRWVLGVRLETCDPDAAYLKALPRATLNLDALLVSYAR